MGIITNNIICFLLPAIVAFYYILDSLFKSENTNKILLIACSLGFYFYIANSSIPFLLLSLSFNFLVANILIQKNIKYSRWLYWGAIASNILLFIALKYRFEVIETYSFMFGSYNSLNSSIIPFGFGMITIQQISFLRECYKGDLKGIALIDYLHFSTFFPKLLAGPITKIEVFKSTSKSSSTGENISRGIFIFFIGLAQKVFFADTLLKVADRGLNCHSLNFVQAWVTTLSNTLGIYFNITAYSAMAIGIGLCFNITLPFNFNHPFRAINIKDFWERWHITFTNFFTESFANSIQKKKGIYSSIGMTCSFLLMALWHKIGFTILIWGFLQAIAIIVFTYFNKIKFTFPKWFAWLITFGFINVSWIFFRTENISQALITISGLLNIKGLFMYYNEFYILWGIGANFMIVLLLIASIVIAVKSKDSTEILETFTISYKTILLTVFLIIIGITFNTYYPILYYGF